MIYHQLNNWPLKASLRPGHCPDQPIAQGKSFLPYVPLIKALATLLSHRSGMVLQHIMDLDGGRIATKEDCVRFSNGLPLS